MADPERSESDSENAPMDQLNRALLRVSRWLESHISPAWFDRMDRFTRAVWWLWAVVLVLSGAAIAGWALGQGLAGVLFGILVGLGAWLLLREFWNGGDDA